MQESNGHRLASEKKVRKPKQCRVRKMSHRIAMAGVACGEKTRLGGFGKGLSLPFQDVHLEGGGGKEKREILIIITESRAEKLRPAGGAGQSRWIKGKVIMPHSENPLSKRRKERRTRRSGGKRWQGLRLGHAGHSAQNIGGKTCHLLQGLWEKGGRRKKFGRGGNRAFGKCFGRGGRRGGTCEGTKIMLGGQTCSSFWASKEGRRKGDRQRAENWLLVCCCAIPDQARVQNQSHIRVTNLGCS